MCMPRCINMLKTCEDLFKPVSGPFLINKWIAENEVLQISIERKFNSQVLCFVHFCVSDPLNTLGKFDIFNNIRILPDRFHDYKLPLENLAALFFVLDRKIERCGFSRVVQPRYPEVRVRFCCDFFQELDSFRASIALHIFYYYQN